MQGVKLQSIYNSSYSLVSFITLLLKWCMILCNFSVPHFLFPKHILTMSVPVIYLSFHFFFKNKNYACYSKASDSLQIYGLMSYKQSPWFLIRSAGSQEKINKYCQLLHSTDIPENLFSISRLVQFLHTWGIRLLLQAAWKTYACCVVLCPFISLKPS